MDWGTCFRESDGLDEARDACREEKKTCVEIYCSISGNSILCPSCSDKYGTPLKYHKFQGTVAISKKEYWFCDECGIQLDIE